MKNQITCSILSATVALGYLLATSSNAAESDKGVPKVAALATPSVSDSFLLHSNDKTIVFLGDSITEQRNYTDMIESYVLSRFPTRNVRFRNVGWSGEQMSLYSA